MATCLLARDAQLFLLRCPHSHWFSLTNLFEDGKTSMSCPFLVADSLFGHGGTCLFTQITPCAPSSPVGSVC